MSRKGNRNPKFKRSIDSPSYASRRRPQINDVMDSITSPPTFPHSVDPADLPPGSVNDDPLAEFVRDIVRAADMRKAGDIVAMRVTKCTSLTNFIVVVSGTSRPQNQAIANSVMKDVEEKFDGKRCLGKVSLWMGLFLRLARWILGRGTRHCQHLHYSKCKVANILLAVASISK
jgi:hypothetical protein